MVFSMQPFVDAFGGATDAIVSLILVKQHYSSINVGATCGRSPQQIKQKFYHLII